VTETSTQSLSWDANNYRKEALSSEVGCSITASGDVRVMAGNEINALGLNATRALPATSGASLSVALITLQAQA